MYHDPIVKDRIRTALAEGIASQSAARARRKSKKSCSLLNKAMRMLGRLRKKRTQIIPQSSLFERRI